MGQYAWINSDPDADQRLNDRYGPENVKLRIFDSLGRILIARQATCGKDMAAMERSNGPDSWPFYLPENTLSGVVSTLDNFAINQIITNWRRGEKKGTVHYNSEWVKARGIAGGVFHDGNVLQVINATTM